MAEWLESQCSRGGGPVLKSVLRNRTLTDVRKVQEWEDRFEVAVARGEIKVLKKIHPGNKKDVEYVLPGDGEKFAARLPELPPPAMSLIPPQATEGRHQPLEGQPVEPDSLGGIGDL
jgi:hypothetical protein